MVQGKAWINNYKDIDEEQVARLAADAGISRLLAKVFISRGIFDISFIREFMKPELSDMHDPFLMDGMDTAVDRILKALKDRESILIYGDYDVDGIVGTSILFDYLGSKGGRVEYFLPDRMEDGYGLTESTVEKVRLLDVSLMITVDCGITSVDEIEALKQGGLDVIVTDHHECKELLPDAYALLNPHKPGCGYPFKELCGAAVALKLIQGLRIRSLEGIESMELSEYGHHILDSRDEFIWDKETGIVSQGQTKLGQSTCPHVPYLDLVALATIADVVPLVGENRVIATHGLKAMESTRNEGLAALINAAGLGDKPISSYGAAFGLAPRVNAAGRLGDAQRGVRLFTTRDRVLAEALAKELDTENRNRQKTENQIIEESIAYVDEMLDLDSHKVLVIVGHGWHSGIIGIVASKLLEKYSRPCIVISVENGIGKGSGRSIKCFNLFKALSRCEDLLDRFGGHEMAAGLTIQEEKINGLCRRINEYADSILSDDDLLPKVRVDVLLEQGDITMDAVRELDQLAPFGEANPGPQFGYIALLVDDIRMMSGGKHLRLRLTDGDFKVDAVGFGMGERVAQLARGDSLDAVFVPEINAWNGRELLQLNLRDIRTCVYDQFDKNIVFNKTNDYNGYIDPQEVCRLLEYYQLSIGELIPERVELEAVYRYIRGCFRGQGGPGLHEPGGQLEFSNLFILSALISNRYQVRLNFLKLRVALEIFRELGLLVVEATDRKAARISVVNGNGKVDLEASSYYMMLRDIKEKSV
ncbi:MAG: single-stranded-DNA-specific exonuclease RecJ [Clostridiaceae bacterium]|nr:single-stranded-DNA-specific exonuclease RecJ [Clostridiaceae bacterium]